MELKVRVSGLSLAQCEASILEIRRQRKAMEGTYPKWVQEGRIAAKLAEARQAAVCGAEIVLCAVAAALSAPPEQGELAVAGATSAPLHVAGAATAAAASAAGATSTPLQGEGELLRKLPYDAGVRCDEPAPTASCRFCHSRLESSVQRQTGAVSYRCPLTNCPANMAWTSLEKAAKTGGV